jgi:hypothetical protein
MTAGKGKERVWGYTTESAGEGGEVMRYMEATARLGDTCGCFSRATAVTHADRMEGAEEEEEEEEEDEEEEGEEEEEVAAREEVPDSGGAGDACCCWGAGEGGSWLIGL